MPSFSPIQETPSGTARSGLKRVLLVILFISAAAGFIAGLMKLNKLDANSAAKPISPKNSPAETRSRKQPLFEKTTPAKPSSSTVVCQGTILSKGYGPIAIINGQPAKTGSLINGVKIVEITASNVLIECRGKTRRLSPGDSFTPGKP